VNDKEIKNLIEMLADTEHNRWSKWQRWLHECGQPYPEGLLLPKVNVDRWQRQIKTNYHNLSDKEKDSDRREALQTLKTIVDFGFDINIKDLQRFIRMGYFPLN
jgi:hypothetical protein